MPKGAVISCVNQAAKRALTLGIPKAAFNLNAESKHGLGNKGHEKEQKEERKEMQQEIITQLKSGKSPEEIIKHLVESREQ